MLTDSLTVLFCDETQSQEWLHSERLLGLVRFGAPAPISADNRICRLALAELGGASTAEVWLGARPVQTGMHDGIYHASDGDVLFLQLALPEADPAALQALTEVAYRRLVIITRGLGYPHLLRIWNYFPEINQEYDGLERYRAFCAGRHQVLAGALREFESRLPAGSALGAQGPGLHLYALAAREPGLQIENPRQLSAFRYPPQYGRRSPSFSRALLKNWSAGCQHLYISGTASIVGHASQHQDLCSQLDETLLNLETLVAEANRRATASLAMALLKIYLRPKADPTPLRARIAERFGANLSLLFLQADICRPELLVEIEGLATSEAAHQSQDYAP